MATITDIPHNLRLYTATEKTWILPADLQCDFFLSFEDALWALVETHDLQGKTILVPDFYCFDVVDNIKAHGLVVQTYRMNADLGVDSEDFKEKVLRYGDPGSGSGMTRKNNKPAIVVIFHPVGIQSELVEIIHDLDDDIFVIEDAVHKVVDPSQVKIVHERHFVIDSWRKVMPLQGSMMIGRKSSASPTLRVARKTKRSLRTRVYSAKVVSLWFMMQVAAKARLGTITQRLMLRGYDVIGDNMEAAGLPSYFVRARERIHYERLRIGKQKQMRHYDEALHEIIVSNSKLFSIQFSQSDWNEMRAYPVGLRFSHADEVIAQLRAHGLLVRAELDDSPWSQRQKVIYLPLGPEIDIDQVVGVFLEVVDKVTS